MFKQHVGKELSAYCHGELGPEDSRRVAAHLESCGRCRKEYEEVRLGVFLAGHLSPETAPAAMWGEIERLLDGQAAGARSANVGWWPESLRFAFPLSGYPLAALTAALVLALGLGAWYYWRLSKPAWEMVFFKAGSDRIEKTGRIAVGDLLATDSTTRAKIEVGKIGYVEVEPNSRIRLVQARETEHRLALDRGTMHAQIYAPPRLFFVNTPSAVAVDYGCAYTLEVDKSGAGLLQVTSGWVALVLQGRESRVPAGAACEMRPGVGPGTPFFIDASDALQQALSKFDFEHGGAESLTTVLAEARRPFDTITLWHLLFRVDEAERGRIYDRMEFLVAPPEGVTREGIMKLDQKMLDHYQEEELAIHWLRNELPTWRKGRP